MTRGIRASGRWLVAAVIAVAPMAALGQGLGATDRAAYSAAFQALNRGDPSGAVALAAGGSDPLAAKIVSWLAMADDDYGTSPRSLLAFVAANPDWPRLNALQRRAERTLGTDLAAAELVAFFDVHPPLTGEGWTAYVSALQSLGQGTRATETARRGWREGSFDIAGQAVFLGTHASLLQADDHWARADRLLWERDDTEAERMLSLLGPDRRALASARLKLARREAGVDDAVAAVPAALASDPGLIYERLRWRRRADLDAGAIEMLALQPFDPPYPDDWWTERRIMVRRLMEEARFADAYRLAADHRQAPGVDYMEAEMTAGWLALRRLDDPGAALDHFLRLFAEATTPISRSRGAYWAARAMQALGDNGQASSWYQVAAQYTHVFYGQLAAAALAPDAPLVLPMGPTPPSTIEAQTFRADELARAALLMSALGQDNYVYSFVWALMSRAETGREYQLIADLATEIGRTELAVWAARRAGGDGTVLYDGYPVVALPAGLPAVDPALIHGLIRQESGFDATAVSSAGARGLMQLMPSTADAVAGSLGIAHSTAMLTSDIGHNLLLGSTYLANRLADFGGSYIMSIAAYNAGPNRSRSWASTYGDPRTAAVDPIDWIELIPFSETRNYVQRVLEGTQLYRVRLGQAPTNSSILTDLYRGG